MDSAVLIIFRFRHEMQTKQTVKKVWVWHEQTTTQGENGIAAGI